MAPRVRLEGVEQLRKLRTATEKFTSISVRLPLQQVVLLCGIAETINRPGPQQGAPVALADVCKHLNIAQSSVSRNFGSLAGRGEDSSFKHDPPLISLDRNPLSDREKVVSLTPDGVKTLRQIISIMEGP